MPDRLLLVTADDFGVGPQTTCGILDLARRGVITSAVLLVNSPYAAEAVRQWQAAGRPLELGWHPCLTLDSPILPPDHVPSLIGCDGRFVSLGALLMRLLAGRIKTTEVEAELDAQLERFVELVGQLPTNVNAHHHVHVFSAVGEAAGRSSGRVGMQAISAPGGGTAAHAAACAGSMAEASVPQLIGSPGWPSASRDGLPRKRRPDWHHQSAVCSGCAILHPLAACGPGRSRGIVLSSRVSRCRDCGA